MDFCKCGRQITRLVNGASAYWCRDCKKLYPVKEAKSKGEVARRKKKAKAEVTDGPTITEEVKIEKRKTVITEGKPTITITEGDA